jgi:glycosyltransferase involved in cell wall biosynthesis
MFPTELQSRIAVQFEGFDLSAEMAAPRPTARADERVTIGGSARDMSSAKGFETFMRLVDRMVRQGQAEGLRFVALGDAQAPTYGYEQQWVQRQYGDAQLSFKDHLLKRYPAADVVEFPGKLPYAQFAQLLGEIDLFLYPLRHGVANWGLMEILARGGCVLGSNWGFVPELVQHDVNGMLLPDDDQAWLAAIASLRADPQRQQRYRQAAMETGKAFHIASVAPRYMDLFRLAMLNQRTRKSAWGVGSQAHG